MNYRTRKRKFDYPCLFYCSCSSSTPQKCDEKCAYSRSSSSPTSARSKSVMECNIISCILSSDRRSSFNISPFKSLIFSSALSISERRRFSERLTLCSVALACSFIWVDDSSARRVISCDRKCTRPLHSSGSTFFLKKLELSLSDPSNPRIAFWTTSWYHCLLGSSKKRVLKYEMDFQEDGSPRDMQTHQMKPKQPPRITRRAPFSLDEDAPFDNRATIPRNSKTFTRILQRLKA